MKTISPYLTPSRIKLLNALVAPLRGTNHTNLNYEQHFITRGDQTKLRVCVYYPKQMKPNAPGVLWIHGGGYALEVPELETITFANLVDDLGVVIVAPDYRRSTEQPYPAALDDCYLALKWLRDHTDDYKIRSDQLVIAGDSAGGGLTAALSLYARDQGEIAVAFQMPLYPMIDDRPTNSSKDNAAPVWSTKSNKLCWQMYLGELSGQADIPIYAAPARATDFTNLPPTISFVGDIEPFYDETCTYMQQLKNAGVPTFLKVFPGAFHAFNVFAPKAQVSQSANKFMLDSFAYCMKNYFSEQKSL